MSILVNAVKHDRVVYDDSTQIKIAATYNLKDGDHFATISGSGTTLITGNGNSNINYYGHNGTIQTGDGNNNITHYGNNGNIKTGNGNSNITSYGNHNNILTGKGNQKITAVGDYNKIKTEDGDDEVVFLGDNCDINLGDGDNNLIFWGNYCNIKTGSGDDNIKTFDQVYKEKQYEDLKEGFLEMLPQDIKTSKKLVKSETIDKWVTRTFFREKTTTVSENQYEVEKILNRYIDGVKFTKINMGTGNNTASITKGVGTYFEQPKLKQGATQEEKEAYYNRKNNITYNKPTTISETISKETQFGLSERTKKKFVFGFIG